MSMGELKKVQRPDFKQTKAGWIPKDWTCDTVGGALDIVNNKRRPISEEVRKTMQGQYPYYGPTKIQDYIDEYRYEGEFALIAEDGDHFLKYREMNMTQLAVGRFNVNNHAHAIHGTDKCDTKWFYWFYNRRSILSHLTRQGAGRYKLNKSALELLPIAYPPREEQKKIIDILDTWLFSIQKLDILIAQKQQKKKGLMQQLLTGKKRFPAFRSEWKHVSVADVASAYSIKNKEGRDLTVLSCTKYDGLVPSLEYFGRKVFSTKLDTYKIVKKNTFAYATNHINEGSIGFQDVDEEGLISPMYTCFDTNDLVYKPFFFMLLKSHEFMHQYGRRTEGSFDRRGGLRWREFSEIKFMLPTIEEQKKIAAVLQAATKEIEILQQKVGALKEQKKGLMQVLLTGKKRLKP